MGSRLSLTSFSRISQMRLPWLYPMSIVGEQRGQIVFEPIGEKQRDTAWRQHLHDLMDEALRHRQGAWADIDSQQQFALGIDGRPHPVARLLKPLDGVL